MALSGDATALRLCLEPIPPPRRDAPVTFDLSRMETAHDASKAVGAVLEAGDSHIQMSPPNVRCIIRGMLSVRKSI